MELCLDGPARRILRKEEDIERREFARVLSVVVVVCAGAEVVLESGSVGKGEDEVAFIVPVGIDVAGLPWIGCCVVWMSVW